MTLAHLAGGVCATNTWITLVVVAAYCKILCIIIIFNYLYYKTLFFCWFVGRPTSVDSVVYL